MPKLLLIQPTQYAHDGSLCKQKKIYLPCLSLPLLASMTPKNWDVSIKIEVVDNINFDEDVDLVGIGTMGHAIFRALDIAKEFKKRGKIVFFGGYMASMVSEKVLSSGYVDSVVIGDAEISYPLLCKDYEDKGNLERIYNHPISKLENLPLPKYELLLEKPIGNMLPVQAGRGCPHSCKFCSIACLYKGKYLTRPVKEVIRDIKKIKELGFNSFYLIDDNIVGNPKYLEQLVKEIKPLNMTWSSQCSLNLAKNRELLKLVASSGCRILSFGIESISQEGLDKLNKKWVNVKEHKKLLAIIESEGIMPSTEMIVGTDSDTEQSLKDTYKFVEHSKIPIPRFYILTPMPSTELYNQYKSENRLLHEDYIRYDGTQCVHRPEQISPEKLTEMYWWLYKKVFSLKSIVKRTLLKKNMLFRPKTYLFAFFINLHYRRYILKQNVPNIF